MLDATILLPTRTMPRGALPTFQLCLTVPVAGSMATARFRPLTAVHEAGDITIRTQPLVAIGV
ncbi:hypothetical protein ADK54_41415 [Streptomyces sp. WM6378]|nr:hypothetical protein ADK54_41415 [Streptomyces sp. WM6378]